MPTSDSHDTFRSPSRRQFLQTSGVALGAALAGTLAQPGAVHAAGSDTLKVGLIGCGGRGTGAAANALKADANAELVALADPFPEKMEGALKGLLKQEAIAGRVKVTPEKCFSGLDGFQKLIDSGVDVVLLAEPPHFRPQHLKAAIDAGKHVFCEKPVAVDAPGVRSVLATAEEAKKKNLNLVSGLCWRYHPAVKETIQRVIDGAIGDVHTIRENYLTSTLSYRERTPGETEMMYQVRNWYYFTWLSGDFNVEQHVHSLDKAMWVMGDKPPKFAWGVGGRQLRADGVNGDIYDHHSVFYEWDNGTTAYAFCRQMAGCLNDTTDVFTGTKGRATVLTKFQIEGANPWRYQAEKGEQPDMYVLEHQALFGAIRSGNTINNGLYMSYSTMLGILGRMTTYTGQKISWDDAINSTQVLAPSAYTWDAQPPTLPDAHGRYPIATPGVTKFA